MDEIIVFGVYQSYWNRGSVGCVSMSGLPWCMWGVDWGLEHGPEEWGGVMSV